MKTFSILAVFSFGLFTLLKPLDAQSTDPTTTANLVLSQVRVPKSDLVPLENKSGKDGPGCKELINLYIDVRAAQGFKTVIKGPVSDCQTKYIGMDYLIVNYVKWDANGIDKPGSIWYLLSPENPRLAHTNFADKSEITTVTDTSKVGDRIFGSNRVGILVVQSHFSNIISARVDYTITLTHKKSVQAGDLDTLIGIVGGTQLAPTLGVIAAQEDVFATAGLIGAVPSLPYDIAFIGEAFLKSTAPPVADAKPDTTFSQTYDNEGYARWDISAAIPVAGLKDVQYTQVGSTVSAKTVSRANAYALAHWYPVKVDLKGDYPWYPSVVAGLALTGKPLDKPFVGLAVGTKKPFPFQINVFAGAVFDKVFTSASATDATQLNSHRVTKLLYGIDIPIGQLTKAIAGK